MPESYTVQLTLRSADEDGPAGRQLLREITEEVLDWATGAEGLKEGSEFPHYGKWESDALGRYEVSGEADDTLEWWEQEWSRPDAHGRKIDWLSQVRLATQGEEVEFRIRVSVRAQVGWITPEYASVRRPNIVPRLVTRFQATYFDDRVDALPLAPFSASRVGDLVERLKDPARRMPIVLISVARGTTDPLMSPEDAADQLAGLAEVVLLQDETASWQLTERVGRSLACFWGAVRLYWPGLDLNTDDPYSHRLWLAQRIHEQGPHSVIDHIFNILCSRVARASGDLPLWKLARDGINLRAESQTLERLQKLSSDSELVTIADEEIKKAERQRDVAASRAEELDKQLTAAQQTVTALEDRLETTRENLRATQEELGRVQKRAGGAVPETAEIQSVLDAVVRAGALPNTQVLKEAIDSARKSQSNRGGDLYKVFCVLDRLATEHRTGLGMGVKAWLDEELPDVSVQYKGGISDTTEGKRGQDYTFGGILMGKHLSFGGGHNKPNHVSVHFEFDFSDGPPRCVIGHVGKHLRNEMS